MAFPSQENNMATSVGDIWHIVKDKVSGPDEIKFVFPVHNQHGVIMRIVNGDELPQLDAEQKAQLVAIFAAQRIKAEATLPPQE